MAWTSDVLALSLRYEHVFQSLEYLALGIDLYEWLAPLLQGAWAWLGDQAVGYRGSSPWIIAFEECGGTQCVGGLPDVDSVPFEMSDVGQKSAGKSAQLARSARAV